MRLRTGHGPSDWTDNIPAEPLSPKHVGGSLVTGAHGSVEMGRIQSRAGNLRAKALREPKKATG